MKILPFRILLVLLAGICLPDLSSGSSERLDALSALKSGGGVLMILALQTQNSAAASVLYVCAAFCWSFEIPALLGEIFTDPSPNHRDAAIPSRS